MPDANHDDTVDCDEVEENENEEEGEEGEKQGEDDSPRGESCAGVLASAWAVCAFAFSTCTQNGRLAARFIGSVCTHRMQTRRSAIQVTMVGSSVRVLLVTPSRVVIGARCHGQREKRLCKLFVRKHAILDTGGTVKTPLSPGDHHSVDRRGLPHFEPAHFLAAKRAHVVAHTEAGDATQLSFTQAGRAKRLRFSRCATRVQTPVAGAECDC